MHRSRLLCLGHFSLRRYACPLPQALLTSLQPVGTQDANGKPTLLGDRPLWLELSKYIDVPTLARMRGTSRNLWQAVDGQAAVIRALGEAFDMVAIPARRRQRDLADSSDERSDKGSGSDDEGSEEDPEERTAVWRRKAQRERRRLAALKKVSELEKAAQMRIDELRRFSENFSQQQQQVRELQFDLKQAERRAGPAPEADDEVEEWSFVEKGRQGQPIKKKYRDRMVKLVIQRNTPLKEAIPAVLDVLSAEESIADYVDEYMEKHPYLQNAHHSARRAVVEIERYMIDDLAFRLAARVGFTRRGVPRQEPTAPDPLSCHMPEAWASGVPTAWEDLSTEAWDAVDPDGKLAKAAAEYKAEVQSKVGSLPPESSSRVAYDHDPEQVLIDIDAVAATLGELAEQTEESCLATAATVCPNASLWVTPERGDESDCVGDLLLVREVTGEYTLNQIVSVVEEPVVEGLIDLIETSDSESGDEDADSDSEDASNGPKIRYTLQAVDPRLINEDEAVIEADLLHRRNNDPNAAENSELRATLEADRYWSPPGGDLSPDDGEYAPILLGKAALQTETNRTDAITTADDDAGWDSDESSESSEQQQCVCFDNPLAPPPAFGVDATSFYDNSTFLCAWCFLQGPRTEQHRNDMFAWAWRMAKGHGPAADVLHIFAFFETMRAVQARMGVPVAQQTFADDIKWFPVDNENSNTGTITALPVRLNYACKLEHDWLVKHGLRTGEFVEKKIIGCGLHVLNLCDVSGSELWRKVSALHRKFDLTRITTDCALTCDNLLYVGRRDRWRPTHSWHDAHHWWSQQQRVVDLLCLPFLLSHNAVEYRLAVVAQHGETRHGNVCAGADVTLLVQAVGR